MFLRKRIGGPSPTAWFLAAVLGVAGGYYIWLPVFRGARAEKKTVQKESPSP
jgi:hypothetical protein